MGRGGLGAGIGVLSLTACGSWVGGGPEGICGGRGPVGLVAVDLIDGSVVWEQRIADAAGLAVAGEVVAGVGDSGRAVAVDAITGERRWCRDLGTVDNDAGAIAWPWFASADGVVASATADGRVVGIEAASGEDLWEVDVGPIEGAYVGAAGDRFLLFDAAADRDSPRRAFDATTGEDVESPPVDAPYVDTRPAGSNGQSIVLSVREPDGSLRWEATVPGYSADLHGDLVVVVDQTGGTGGRPVSPDATVLTAYDATTGAERWTSAARRAGFSTAATDDLILAPAGGGLLAVDRTDGHVVWDVDLPQPGRGGRYSEPGGPIFLGVVESAPDRVVVGVKALEPYRD